MNSEWLQTRIFCNFSNERIDVEADHIILTYVLPTFQQVKERGWVESRYFKRFSGGGHHIDMRCLADGDTLRSCVRPFIQKTLPLFLHLNFPPPPAEVVASSHPRFQKLNERFGEGDIIHAPYTFTMRMLDNVELIDPLLTPVQRAVDDLSAMMTIALLSDTAVTAPKRYLWALLASCWSLRPLHNMMHIASFCEGMSEQWFTQFEINTAWRHIFTQKYAHSGPQLTRLLGLDLHDSRLTAVLGAAPTSSLIAYVEKYNKHLPPLMNAPAHILNTNHVELMAATAVHLLHNRLGLTLEEELFTNYLLARFFADERTTA